MTQGGGSGKQFLNHCASDRIIRLGVYGDFVHPRLSAAKYGMVGRARRLSDPECPWRHLVFPGYHKHYRKFMGDKPPEVVLVVYTNRPSCNKATSISGARNIQQQHSQQALTDR